MNKEVLYDTIKNIGAEKIETISLLIDYYKSCGLNVRKASEEAEKSINSFLALVNDEVIFNSGQNSYCLFDVRTNQAITFINKYYFKVQDIKNKIYNSITDSEFELLCANILKNYLGALNTGVTKKSGDGGFDFFGSIISRNESSLNSVVSVKVFGQSKQYGGNISRPEIDKFIGFAKRTQHKENFTPCVYIFATTSNFSPEALSEANNQGIICWNGYQLASFIFQSTSNKEADVSDIIKEFL
ncbi:MAG: restriction endonuclease [Saprospiraceae bacterium]|nr:restriction endonuclease [Saprospiraceae bacterium]